MTKRQQCCPQEVTIEAPAIVEEAEDPPHLPALKRVLCPLQEPLILRNRTDVRRWGDPKPAKLHFGNEVEDQGDAEGEKQQANARCKLPLQMTCRSAVNASGGFRGLPQRS